MQQDAVQQDAQQASCMCKMPAQQATLAKQAQSVGCCLVTIYKTQTTQDYALTLYSISFFSKIPNAGTSTRT